MRRQILMNICSNWGATLIGAVVIVLIVPLMLSGVGVEGYGVWSLLSSSLAYVTILDQAFALAINRFVAYHLTDIEEVNRVVSTSFLILLGMASVTLVGAIGVSLVVCRVFGAIPPTLASEARLTTILVGATLACKMIEANFAGTLRGAQLFTHCNGVASLFNLVRLAITAGFLMMWKSIVAVQAAFLISAAASALAMFLACRMAIPGLRVSLALINRKCLGELFHQTVHSIARSGSRLFMMNTLVLLVGWKGTATDVTVYNIAWRLPEFVAGFIAGAQTVFLPVATSLCAEGQIDRMRSLVNKGTHMSCVLTGLSTILLFVFAPDILQVWLKGSAPAETAMVMRVVILATVPGGCFDIWLPVLVGMGRLRLLTVTAITTAILAVGASVVLLCGVTSVAMAPALALVIAMWVKGIWVVLQGVKELDLPLADHLRSSLWQPSLASLISILTVYGWHMLVPETTFHRFLSIGIITALVFFWFGILAMREELARAITYGKGVSVARREYRS